MSKYLLPFLFLGLFLTVTPEGAFAQGRQVPLPDIIERGGGSLSIFIASNSSDVRQLATRAFRTHGQYRNVGNAAQADFAFIFTYEGGNRVDLRIESGNPARNLYRQSFNGSSSRNALFRAADAAVRQTTGRPGYFAGRLTFVVERNGAREVNSSDLFLGERVQLTSDGSKSVGPRWSPDGRQILYTSYYRSGFPDIFIIDLHAQRRTPLVTFRGTNTGARFSPDGSRIAMVLSGEGNPEIYVSNATGRQIRRLTRTNSVQSSPSWSPDGSELAFTSDRDGRPQLFRMSANGGSMQRIPTNISGYCAEPDWNPVNSSQLAFTAAVERRFAIALYDFSTRESRFLTTGPADAVEPRWLNDGRHLIYTARTARSEILTILDTVTGKSTPVSSSSAGRLSQPDFRMP